VDHVTAAEAKTFADQSVAALADAVQDGWVLPSELDRFYSRRRLGVGTKEAEITKASADRRRTPGANVNLAFRNHSPMKTMTVVEAQTWSPSTNASTKELFRWPKQARATDD